MAFVGVWEPGGGDEVEKRAIIETAVDAFISSLNNRMPVVIAPGEYATR